MPGRSAPQEAVVPGSAWRQGPSPAGELATQLRLHIAISGPATVMARCPERRKGPPPEPSRRRGNEAQIGRVSGWRAAGQTRMTEWRRTRTELLTLA
jgi:hypothetical protein